MDSDRILVLEAGKVRDVFVAKRSEILILLQGQGV